MSKVKEKKLRVFHKTVYYHGFSTRVGILTEACQAYNSSGSNVYVSDYQIIGSTMQRLKI